MYSRNSLPDPASLTAIDTHVHLWAPPDEDGDETADAALERFSSEVGHPTAEATAAYYREHRMVAVLLNADSETATGRKDVTGAQVLAACEAHPDVFIPFVGVDPWKGQAALNELEALIEGGARGFKFHPPGQAFYPNEHRFWPLWERIEATGLPVIFHTGQTAIGANLPGGGGLKLKYGNPMFLDDLAADFPGMPIIMAHPSFPWQDEALAVAVHKPQVYIDLSGWSPKYFPPQLVHYANTLLKDKMLFGSDWPLLTPDRWLKAFEEAPFRDEVRPLILKDNAVRLLDLGS